MHTHNPESVGYDDLLLCFPVQGAMDSVCRGAGFRSAGQLPGTCEAETFLNS